MEKVQHCCYSPEVWSSCKRWLRAQRRMLRVVKKNPWEESLNLQKSLAHANIIVAKSTISKTSNKNGIHERAPRREPLLSKKLHCCTLEVCKRAPGCSTALLAKCSVDRWNQNSYLEGTHNTMCREKRHSRPPSNPPTVKYSGGGIMVWDCLKAWTDCCHRRKNEFPRLSRHFAGKLTTICLQSEA